MMTKRQWFSLLCIFMCYILFGATVFYMVESVQEEKRLLKEQSERYAIEELLENHYVPSKENTLDDMHYRISDYCNKPMGEYVPHKKTQLNWTFYHSMFFVLTIVSTIGYGNLSPTTPFTRTFMIVYGLIGIPINGMVVITLGDFFGKTFVKLYRRWKNSRVEHTLTTLGLLGQIILYLIPGMAIFIFIPSLIILLYEEWTYDIAIEFAFATLTTIGVGNHVPGTRENERGEVLFLVYRAFLLIWIIMGLGYLAMVFGFISRGLRSKKLHAIEHRIAHNIKKTNRKIRQEFRAILNEHLLMRVQPVYRERRRNITVSCGRTVSCPDLTFGRKVESPKMRRRAVSELTKPSLETLSRTRSDTDLECIDKKRTFMSEVDLSESSRFLLRVANALGNYNMLDAVLEEVSDKEDGKTDHFNSNWNNDDNRKFSKATPEEMRPRAASESKTAKAANNFNLIRSKNVEHKKLQGVKEEYTSGRARSQTLPSNSKPHGLLIRLKNSFGPKDISLETIHKNRNSRNRNLNSSKEDIESTYAMVNREHLLEQTSIADFLRALGKVDVSSPRRKFGIVHQMPPTITCRTRRAPIAPNISCRRISLVPASPSQDTKQRRFSLDPGRASNDYTTGAMLPVYSTIVEVENEKQRRFTKRSRRLSVMDKIKFKNEKDKKA